MRILYVEHEDADGEIGVAATPEEWRLIQEFLDAGPYGSTESFEKASEFKNKLLLEAGI